MIVYVEATPANRAQEVASTKTMIERVKDRFALSTQKLIGDTAYGTAELLAWMVSEHRIEPHVPVWEKSERNRRHVLALRPKADVQMGSFGRL